MAPFRLILAGVEHSDAARAMLAQAGIPIVEIMDVDGQPVDFSSGISHYRAGRQMAEAIIAAGYRRIAFLGTHMPEQDTRAASAGGVRGSIATAGLSLVDREYYAGGSSLLQGRAMTEAVMERTPDVDFLYYSNDMIGAGGLLWCLGNGLDVPGKIGLAGSTAWNCLPACPANWQRWTPAGWRSGKNRPRSSQANGRAG